MSSLEIRPTLAADLPFITEVYDHAVRFGTATFELIPPDLAEMTQRFNAVMDGGFPYLVAVLEGRVVGYAYAAAYRLRPAYRFTVEDPGTWTKPWPGEVLLKRFEGPIFEYACHEGNYAMEDILGGARRLETETKK